MTFEETIKFLNSSFENLEITQILAHNKNMFMMITNEIEKQIKHLVDNDDPLPIDDKLITDINKVQNILKVIYMDVPMKIDFPEFVMAYSKLIINWNNNTLKDKEIQNNFSFIYRIYDGRLVTEELFYYCKDMFNKLKTLKDYTLPSIELSRQYLKDIDEGE